MTFAELGWDAWYTLGILAIILVALVRNIGPADVILFGGAVLLALAGVLDQRELFEGFINNGVLTIAALFVVAAALRETGALDIVGERLLGNARSERMALVRLAVPVTACSAFINNTPVVAMLVPMVLTWCRKFRVSPSKVLLPISYFAVLGGTCTLIGTSTHLVMDGMIRNERRVLAANGTNVDALGYLQDFGLFELAWVGVPFALIGMVYMLTAGRRLLPEHKAPYENMDAAAREYLLNMRVEPGCRLAGRTVEVAGMRHLPGLFLVEIARGEDVIAPVQPSVVIREGDTLTFTGEVSTIVDLERIPGLVPVADEGYINESAARRVQSLFEAVISSQSPLIGKSIRDAQFRATYNAAVIAVHRGGQRLRGRVGDIVLRAGDTLLLQAGPHFESAHRNSRNFYLVSGVLDSRSVRDDRSLLSAGLLVLLVALMASGAMPTSIAAFFVAGLMVATRCVSAGIARSRVDWQTLIAIGASIAIGRAVENTGIAQAFADSVIQASSSMDGTLAPYIILAIAYVMTLLFTELMTNYAAVTLMFPVALAFGTGLGVDPKPFLMAVTYAAATSLVTPLGYQTHLMVFGPGGYRFADFVKVGLPLSIVLAITGILLIPMIWGF